MEVINFPQAVSRLLDFKGQATQLSPKPFLSATKIQKPPSQDAQTVYPIQNSILINYIQERAIPYSLGKKYLHEIITHAEVRTYYSVGFPNDSHGFALRNKYFKGCEGSQDITPFDLESRSTVAVFEGFFDFLSAMVYYGLTAPRIPTVVLNSTNNRKKAVEYLRQFEQVNCFFDRDKSGEECFRLMRDRDKLPVKDQSSIYEGFNDFNEFLIRKQ